MDLPRKLVPERVRALRDHRGTSPQEFTYALHLEFTFRVYSDSDEPPYPLHTLTPEELVCLDALNLIDCLRIAEATAEADGRPEGARGRARPGRRLGQARPRCDAPCEGLPLWVDRGYTDRCAETVAALRTLGVRGAARVLEAAVAEVERLRPAGKRVHGEQEWLHWFGSRALVEALEVASVCLGGQIERMERSVLAYARKYRVGGVQ